MKTLQELRWTLPYRDLKLLNLAQPMRPDEIKAWINDRAGARNRSQDQDQDQDQESVEEDE